MNEWAEPHDFACRVTHNIINSNLSLCFKSYFSYIWIEFWFQHYIEARIQLQSYFLAYLCLHSLACYILYSRYTYTLFSSQECRKHALLRNSSLFSFHIGKHFIDHPLILNLQRKNSGGISPFVDVWNKDQDRQFNAGLKDKAWPYFPFDHLLFFSGRKLLKVFCGIQLRVLLS